MSNPLPIPKTDAISVSQPTRPKYSFKVPKESRLFANDPESVAMVPVNVDEEQTAMRVSEATKASLGYELIKHSLIQVNGKPISWEEKEKLIDRISPPVRQLLMTAFDKINNVTTAAKEDFLASMVIET